MCEVKFIACEAAFKVKSNLNVFEGVVIICQEIVVAAFTPFITIVKCTG